MQVSDIPGLYVERDVNGRYIPKQHPLSSCPAQGVPYSRIKRPQLKQIIKSEPVQQCPKWIKSLVNVFRHRV